MSFNPSIEDFNASRSAQTSDPEAEPDDSVVDVVLPDDESSSSPHPTIRTLMAARAMTSPMALCELVFDLTGQTSWCDPR